MRAQSVKYAVMNHRIEPASSLDYYPTPPWATRALIEQLERYHVTTPALADQTVLEPACGSGEMAQTLAEAFGTVIASDVYDYGYGDVRDYTRPAMPEPPTDWIITNAPFQLAEVFVARAASNAFRGVAILTRLSFLESFTRYKALFERDPPTAVYTFVERVPMHRGKLLRRMSTATSYCWLVWDHEAEPRDTYLRWIKPCRRRLECWGDYWDDVGK